MPTTFESHFQVRPDDIDMNQHVHNSTYFDYVLAARYDQMKRCYGMPMEDFLRLGYGWVVRIAHVEYKRPLGLGDHFIVRTWIEEMKRFGVIVQFEIERSGDNATACQGWFDYVMIDTATGRPQEIPEFIIEKYSI
jgi:YbgC/YbaW family acyl-CoA thioester hydrolase